MPLSESLRKKPVDRFRVRRALGHYCARCRKPWALQARRVEEQSVGARFLEWVISCRYCDYRRSHVVLVELAQQPPVRAVTS